MRKVTKKWTCKDGRKIRICDMTDSHLANTIAMLERAAPAARQQALNVMYFASSCLQGEMASYYAEQDIDRLEQSTVEEFLSGLFPVYADLVIERDRREIISLKN